MKNIFLGKCNTFNKFGTIFLLIATSGCANIFSDPDHPVIINSVPKEATVTVIKDINSSPKEATVTVIKR